MITLPIDEVVMNSNSGLAAPINTAAGALAHGEKQWLELGMAIVQDPQLLLVDEPVAGMTAGERQRTGSILEAIAAQRSVVVVEHDMQFVSRFSSLVTVLHAGRVICEGDFDTVRRDPAVGADRFARVPLEELAPPDDFELGLAERLAVLKGDRAGDLVLAPAHESGGLADHLGPMAGRRLAPHLEAGGRGGQGVVEILRAGDGEPADLLLGRRVDHRHLRAGGPPLALDVKPKLRVGRHGAAP